MLNASRQTFGTDAHRERSTVLAHICSTDRLPPGLGCWVWETPHPHYEH